MAVFTSENILVVPDLDSYELKEGQINGGTVFDDSQINDAADAAQAAASKLIIAEGAVAAYDKNQQFFLNCDVFDTENGEGKFSYDYLIDSSLTYDLEVNGTFKSYQILLNNAKTVVSESGKLFAMGEALRVMGGTFNVQGNRAEGAADPAASDVFTGNWGIGTQAGSATQIKSGYLQINQGAEANFKDTVVFINAGWFNVNNAEVAFDNTYIYLGSGGSYAPVSVEFLNGANVTLANNSSMVYDPEFTMNITVDADSTFALSNSKLSATSLTNDGKFTVAGESTLNIASLLGEETVDLLDGAIIKDSTIGGSVFVAGNVTFRGDNTFGMIYDYGTLTDYYGTTAAMAWTVEAGSSVTLSSKDRYGLGYGDKVAVNGNIAANGAAAARATLEDEDSANDVKQSLFMHGLVAMEGKGWNCDSSFTVNNAFVTIGSNSSFGNKPGNNGGTYTFSFDNSVLNASRITFYEALSTTEFTLKDSDVKTGQFMTRDKDSVYTLDNTDFLSTSTINGNDEGNYNAGTLNVTNGSTLTYSSKMVNEENGVINIDNAFFKAPEVENNNVINVTGASTLDLKKVEGSGWIYMNDAELDSDTVIKGANVRFASGENTVDGATITGGRFQVGNGVYQAEDPMVDSEKGVVVNVKNNAVIGGIDGGASPFGGWVGSAYYDKQEDKDAIMTDARYTLNIDNSTAEFGYLHISHDGIMNVKGDAAELSTINATDYSFCAGFLNINGVATFDNVHAMAFNTNVSVDNATETPGKLIVTNGAVFYAKHQDSGNTSSFKISNGGIVEVSNGATFYIGQAGAALNIAAENGQLNINGATLNAGTVNNSGTITVTGKSTVQIETLTGNYVKFDTAELVGDSNIGGNARAYNDFALAGTLTVKQFNMYGDSIVKAGAVLNGSTTIVGGGSDFTLENGGEINSRFFNVVGTANIAGEINLGHSDPRQKLLQLHEGGIATIAETAVITIDGHNAIVNAGGTLNVNGTLNITKWAGANNEAPERGGNLYNEGTVVLSEKAKVTMTTYTSENGIFEINVTDGWRGVATVVDAVAGTFSADDITINAADAADGLSYRIDEATGDLVIYNADTDKIYVNSAWSGALGEEVAEGKYFGINAFDSLTDVVASETAKSLEIAGGTYSNIEGVYSNAASVIKGGITEITATGEVIIDKGSLVFATETAGEIAITGNFTTADKVRYTGTWGVDWAESQNGHIRFVGGDDTVFVIDGKFTSGENIQFIGGSAVISEDSVLSNNPANWGQYLINGANVTNYGSMNLNLANVNGSAMNILAGGTLTLSGEKAALNINMKDGGAANKDINVTNGSLVLEKGASLAVTGAVTVAAAGVVSISGSSFSAGAVTNAGSITADCGFSAGVFTNTGVVTFNFDSETVIPAAGYVLINANAASDYGTVTVTGAAAGFEAVAVGEDLYLLDMSKIYVNSAYGEEGAVLAEGLYLGINAFASFADLNKSVFSQGDRTVVYTYNGSNPAAQITVTNDAKTSSLLSYSFDGRNYNFYSGSRTHEVTLSKGGTYTFDFAKGDFSFAMAEIVKNDKPKEIGTVTPDAPVNVADEKMAVSDEAGDKTFNFTVVAGTTADFVCNYSNVNGTARVTLYDAAGNQLSSKLFNKEGSFSAKELAAGDYKIVFSGYGMNPDADLTASFTLTATELPVVTPAYVSDLDDTRDAANPVAASSGAVDLTNWVGAEDKVDWFRVTELTAGSHNFGVDVEGSNLAVNLYSELNGRYTTLATFSVTDKSDDAADYSRTVKIAEGANLIVKVTGKGEASDYSISIA